MICSLITFRFPRQRKENKLGDPGILLQAESPGMINDKERLGAAVVAGIPDGGADANAAAAVESRACTCRQRCGV